MTHDTIPARLFERARLAPDDPAYFVKRHGLWQGTSWSGYAGEVLAAAKSLIALGVEPEQCVALIGANRPEWSIVMLAAMSIGARAAGIYSTSSLEETRAILEQTEARVVLVDSDPLLQRVAMIARVAPHLRRIITIVDGKPVAAPLALAFGDFLQLGKALPDRMVHERVERLRADSVATLVYTSGAEGTPRGAMLTQRNLTWTSDVVASLLHIERTDSSLSYLPLAHISEQLFTVHGPVCTGSTVYYSESTRSAPANLREVQPTLLFGVPRIWEKLQSGMEARLAAVHGARGRIITWARAVATRVVSARCEGKEPSLELAAQYELANSLVLEKLRRALGLGEARVCLSGAAPTQRETLAFFASLGIQLLEVYGQSESSGPIALNQPRRARFGSSGPKLPGVNVTIAEDGEILTSGPNVFVGYHQNASASSEALVAGVLHTGDLGQLDSEGFLTVTGRKREILVTAGGRNVSPRMIEARLMREELVRDAVVIGDRRRFLSALITIDEDVASALGLSGELHENDVVRERVARCIEQLNGELGSSEQVRRHAILPRNFAVETGELTPTLKLRRQRIEELWANEIDGLYRSDDPRPSARV